MEEISKDQLEERIVRLQQELDRKDLNYLHLERERIHKLSKITERQLEEAKAECKNLDKEIEDIERQHQVELKVYKQKMKHLLCEHQKTTSELKVDGLTSTDTVQKEQARLETTLHERMKDVQELDLENLEELKLKHAEEITKRRNSWEVKLTEIRAKCEEKKLELKQQLDNIRKTITIQRTDFWNNYIVGYTADDILSDVNAGLQQDLEKKYSLQKQLNTLKGKQKEKALPYYLQDNKHFRDVLTVIEKETEIMEKKYTRHSKYSIQNKRPIIKAKAKHLANLKRDCAVLEQKLSQLQLKRDEVYKSFTQNVDKAQHNADLRKMRLSKGLEAVTESLEKTQAQLSSVLSASNMDQSDLARATNNIEEDINSSKDCIKDLLYIKAKISKARKELLLTHEAQQRALGVPTEELCRKLF
ncbi:hypothetical protein PAMP_022753 [Pampus punctatissimus]